MSRRVRPAVLRHRIAVRLEREHAAMAACADGGQVSPEWCAGYLVGLRIARAIVREGG